MSVTEKEIFNPNGSRILKLSWTAEADGSFTSYTTTTPVNGKVSKTLLNPGSVTPTDNYDPVLSDKHGVDVMGGTLANKDTANSENEAPLVGGAYVGNYVDGPLTLTITGNSVASATGDIYIYID